MRREREREELEEVRAVRETNRDFGCGQSSKAAEAITHMSAAYVCKSEIIRGTGCDRVQVDNFNSFFVCRVLRKAELAKDRRNFPLFQALHQHSRIDPYVLSLSLSLHATLIYEEFLLRTS